MDTKIRSSFLRDFVSLFVQSLAVFILLMVGSIHLTHESPAYLELTIATAVIVCLILSYYDTAYRNENINGFHSGNSKSKVDNILSMTITGGAAVLAVMCLITGIAYFPGTVTQNGALAVGAFIALLVFAQDEFSSEVLVDRVILAAIAVVLFIVGLGAMRILITLSPIHVVIMCIGAIVPGLYGYSRLNLNS